MPRKSADKKHAVRPLRASDLERMIAIDEAHTGHTRRRFFEKRLDAAEREAQDFIHIGMERDGKLTGFLLQTTGSYVVVFVIAGTAYLAALAIVQLIVPRLDPVRLATAPTLDA